MKVTTNVEATLSVRGEAPELIPEAGVDFRYRMRDLISDHPEALLTAAMEVLLEHLEDLSELVDGEQDPGEVM